MTAPSPVSTSPVSTSSGPTSPGWPSPGATALRASGLGHTFDGRPVLDQIDLAATPGQVLVVTGENGTGKSTLLAILAGLIIPTAGSVTGPPVRGHLHQEPSAPAGATVTSVLHAWVEPLLHLEARVADLGARLALSPDDASLATSYAAALEAADAAGAWDAERRLAEHAHRLGVGHLAPERAWSSLSGGERSRLALAGLLARRPDVLLLDEPTNHLDDAAVAHLVTALREHRGVAVVVSHDRWFVDQVADRVLDLDARAEPGAARSRLPLDGGYTAVVEARASARRRWEEDYRAQEEQRARLQRAARTTDRQIAPGRPPRDGDKFIHHAKGEHVARTVGRRVANAERRLERLDAEAVPAPPRPLRFAADLGRRGAAVRARDLEVPGRLSLPRLDVRAGEHLLVTGLNGSGKSTLLSVLAGRAPDGTRGEVLVASTVGLLPQQVRFRHPGRSALATYAAAQASATSYPSLGSLGLLPREALRRPVGELSVGQQRRLALAVLVARSPEVVLLDEPTNHLSLALADELEEALARTPATVLVATHDRWLRERWDGPVLRLGGTATAPPP